MSVVFRINGRGAIPVRAIPYMADTTVSADILVRGLLSVDPIKPLHGLSAYELLDYGVCRKVSPWEWRRFAIKLQALADGLHRQESNRELTEAEATAKWKQESVMILPAKVFLWKDEFQAAHIKSYRRLSNEELAKNRSYWIERMNELIASHDDSETAEFMAAHGAPENWREVLQEGIDERAADCPFNPEQFYAYAPNWSGPKDTNTPADVNFTPIIDKDDLAAVMEGFEEVITASPMNEIAPMPHAEQNLPSDRFEQRAMQDGFDNVQRERAGETNIESKVGKVNTSAERCMELARKEALTIADWIELTGISRGKHGVYVVKRKSVSFIKWERSLIAGWPSSDQADMERENETAPLRFPCSPARLIQFIDNLPVEIHAFSVPDAFRQAVSVTENVQATDTAPQEPTEPPEPADTVHSGGPARDSQRTIQRRNRSSKMRAILQSFIDDGVRADIDSIWLHIMENRGKAGFPFATASASTAIDHDGVRYQKASLSRALGRMLKTMKTDKDI